MLEPRYKKQGNVGLFSMRMSSMYYNPIASFWEPFIERTKFLIEMDELSLRVKSEKGLNINISDTFIDVLAMTWESWNERKPTNGRQLLFKFNLVDDSSSQDKSEGEEQGLCPFSVKNETGMSIYLSKMYGSENEQKEILIQNGAKFDIRINYEETIENLLKASNENVILTDTLFKITFDSIKNYAPIKELNFNKVGTEIHYLTKSKVNYLVYSVTLDKMMKALTIRTPFRFINKTSLKLKFSFFIEGEHEFILKPNDKFAIPIELMDIAFILSQEDNVKNSASYSQTANELLRLFSSNSAV